jgi:hypothetical protein
MRIVSVSMATAGVVAKLRRFDLLLESDGAGRSPTGRRRAGGVAAASGSRRRARATRARSETSTRTRDASNDDERAYPTTCALECR